jgi:hypothetical protein
MPTVELLYWTQEPHFKHELNQVGAYKKELQRKLCTEYTRKAGIDTDFGKSTRGKAL